MLKWTRIFSTMVLLLFAMALPGYCAEDTVEVVVEGMAPIQNGDIVKARDVALADALRSAIEQAVGTIVDSQTRVRNYAVLQDSIYTRVTGYIARYQIEGSFITDGVLYMKVRATVKQGEIKDDLSALQLVIESAGDPRVMVLIPEQHISRPVPDPAAETEIIRQLLDAGFLLVDQNIARQARNTEAARRALAGDNVAARNIANEYGADILVIGEAFSELVGNFSGLISCRARVEARVVRADTGEILAAHGVHESGVDITEGIASKKALAKAGTTMAAYLKTAVPKKLAPAELSIEVSASGLSFTEVEKLRRLLQETYMVKGVLTREYINGTVRIDVRTSLKAMELAEEISTWKELKLEVIGVSGVKIELQKFPHQEDGR